MASKTKITEKKLYRQEGTAVPFTWWPWFMVANDLAEKYFKTKMGDLVGFCQGTYCWVYWESQGLDETARYFFQNYSNPKKFAELYADYLKSAKELEGIYLAVDYLALSQVSETEFLKYYQRVWGCYRHFWQTSLFIDAFDAGVDQEEIGKMADKYQLTKEEVGILTGPSQMSFSNERLLFLMEIVAKFLSGEKENLEEFVSNNPLIKEYKQKFGYYKSDYAFIRPIEDQEIVTEISKLISDQESFLKELELLRKQTSIQEDRIKQILKKHKLKENPLAFFGRLTDWREHRKKHNLMGFFALDAILKVIEDKTVIPQKYLQYLDYEEVAKAYEGLISREILETRWRGCCLILTGKDHQIISGEEALSLRDELERRLAGDTAQTTIAGQTACQGYARGIARIVMASDDFAKLNPGEILVTGMTRPEFVPVMKKAAAIVTNEGGITCHAAIVARELGKPCIIGTRNATEMIKDGDLIEVRANHATVRILERATHFNNQ